MSEKPARKRGGSRNADGSAPRDERETYKGHDIVIPRGDPGHRVLVDGEPLRYGRSGNRFYLDVYAYDPDPSLLAVVKRYIDYREGDVGPQAKERGR